MAISVSRRARCARDAGVRPVVITLPAALRRLAMAATLVVTAAATAFAQCPVSLPVQGAPPPQPVFPADNWWNLDISAAPVDASSAAFIAFINNGGTRKLHPDFGGEVSPGSTAIYGMPYAIVSDTQAPQAVTFQYWDESDGVDMTTGQGVPFYPIPAQAITQAHWVEGGSPANVDQRSSSDRHLLMIDCVNRHLYELYNVYYNATQSKWYAGSGAFFDMNTSDRRPDGWTSADAAGLAIFPGLVRYDEAFHPDLSAEIRHAFRVTVRATNGYVYPASHRAGTTSGALPMGARLRLKTSVGGSDPALRTADPNLRRIFRAMQKYGLIVADNGTDMYVTGTFDTRWNSDILNPAFSLLSASDFDVIERGWNPPTGPAALSTIAASPNPVVGGNSSTGTVTLTAVAPAGGASVALFTASPNLAIPGSVLVAAGSVAASFPIATSAVSTSTTGSISATYNSVSKSVTLTINPVPPPPAAALSSLALSPTSVIGGGSVTGTVTLTAAAPSGGASISLASSNTSLATVPPAVVVAAGATTNSFTVTTKATKKPSSVTILGSYLGVTKSAPLSVRHK
ncbi:MAG TPA: hypothetical protein VN634_03765 [Candidatus Limnocylindrales bacterium]|nr:hypothetical protein [Candidatus Limnocylindrales bacterium]